MKLFEMLIDEEQMLHGINAISLVENPAIQSDFIALSKEDGRVILSSMDEEKRILIGAALIPNKPIYRNMSGEEFYIYFSENTIRQAAEMFFKNHNQQQATLEHDRKIEGMTVFESWIVEDEVHDKSRKYGLEAPVGSWVVTMKVDDDEIWNNYVKNNKVFGFSIEGHFASALAKDYDADLSQDPLEAALQNVKKILKGFVDAD